MRRRLQSDGRRESLAQARTVDAGDVAVQNRGACRPAGRSDGRADLVAGAPEEAGCRRPPPDADRIELVGQGKRGNPVVWSRRFFADLSHLEGDVGARHLIGSYPEAVVEVPVTGSAAFIDVDTPDALRAVRAEIEGV